MNDRSVRLLSDEIGSTLSRAISRATSQITLVAPFITRPALDRALSDANPSVPVLVLTRWRVDEIAAGVSDPSILDVVSARPDSRVLLSPRLHAKIFLVDDDVAIVGSANITELGLGFSAPANLELMIELAPVPTSAVLFVRRLEQSSIPATEDLRKKFEDAARTLAAHRAAEGTPPPIIELPEPQPTQAPFWPALRNPQRLHDAYVSLQALRDREEREAAVDDLLALALPDEIDPQTFREAVGRKLLAFPAIVAFDGFLTAPRRFGELTAWLKRQYPDWAADDTVCDRRIQTLIRWLLHFVPDRYRLEQPHYTEFFGCADGWPETLKA